MTIKILTDADAVAAEAARIIAAEARAAVTARGRFIMAVSGGKTPWQMLRALAHEEVPWKNVHVVQVDERIAPAGDPDRNLTHLRESLLSHAPLPPEQIHAMPVEESDLEAAAAKLCAHTSTNRRLATRPRSRPSWPWGRRAHGFVDSRRSGAERHRSRRRGDGCLPEAAANDADVSRCSIVRAGSCGW